MVRDGATTLVPEEEVVVGDLIPIENNVKTGADLLLVRAYDLQASEAMFTGESDPKAKQVVSSGLPLGTSILKHVNIVYDGAIPVGKRNTTLGLGVAIGIGKNTLMGSKKMSFREEKSVSPLADKIGQVSAQAMWFALLDAVAIFGMRVASIYDFDGRGEHSLSDDPENSATTKNALLISAFMASVSMFGLGVPEPLAGLSKACSMVASRQMAKQGVAVRNMKDALDIGYASVLCYDKTGTITTNQMRVVRVLVPTANGRVSVSSQPSCNLAIACVACTDAVVEGDTILEGKPTDAAALIYGNLWTEKLVLPFVDVVEKIPFNSTKKFSGCRYDDGTMVFKGAYEGMLATCTHVLLDGELAVPIDAASVSASCDELAALGYRVMAFTQSLGEHTCLLGVIGIEDPPLPEARAAMQQLQAAGITLCMITGDAKLTAVAICEKIGVVPAVCRTGPQVDELVASGELSKCVPREGVQFLKTASFPG